MKRLYFIFFYKSRLNLFFFIDFLGGWIAYKILIRLIFIKEKSQKIVHRTFLKNNRLLKLFI